MNSSRENWFINHNMLARYLIHKKWTQEQLRNDVSLFTDKDGEIEIVLRRSNDDANSDQQIMLAIKTLSDYYDKPADSIAKRVSNLLSDRISGRIPNEFVRNDSIPLETASEYVTQMRKFLSSTATTELSGERFFQRTLKEAKEYADECRFGHTFKGSFGFVIRSPVTPNDSPTFDEMEEKIPLGRRVIERVALGFEAVQRATKAEDVSKISSDSDALSANMCDALADIFDKTEISKFNFEIDYSPEWKRHQSVGTPRKFKLEKRSVDLLRSASKTLKVPPREREIQIVGLIRRMSTDAIPSNVDDGVSEREIEINWASSEKEVVKVKVKISPDDYLKAVDAHKQGQAVSIVGKLPTEGKTRTLNEASSLTVVSNDN